MENNSFLNREKRLKIQKIKSSKGLNFYNLVKKIIARSHLTIFIKG